MYFYLFTNGMKFQNLCSQKNIDRCLNATQKYGLVDICHCDLDAGSYDIPAMSLPLRMKTTNKNGRVSFRKTMLKNYLNQKGVNLHQTVVYSIQQK